MLRQLFLFCISISFLFIQHAHAASPDLTFNVPHTKSKADVYKTILSFFEKKEAQHDYRLGSIKNFKQGSIDVFSFYKCDTVAQSYKLNVIVSGRNVTLHYTLPEEKLPDASCINRTYDRWIALKDLLARTIDSLKDATTSSIPPDAPAGLGFKNIPFGINSDSVKALLEMSGYIEGDHQVSLHPKFYENYFEKDTTAGKKSFTLVIKLEKNISKVKLGFTPDDKFYTFQIELPSRTAEFFRNVRDKDCLFLNDVFKEKYGEPDTTCQPEKDAVTPAESNLTGMWRREHYTAYTAISFGNAKYSAVGVVKSNPLEKAVKKLQSLEKKDKMKSAAEGF